ncbi:MAG: hypothetical protein HKM93_09405 [Desulfobacteraceae bacterium]|nr:hypothetical protein [Desulfobacteraceae bacterium]
MHIPSYQIHNVLNVYRRQLSKNKLLANQLSQGLKEPIDTIEISPQGKRKSVMEKVAADIVNKITNFGDKSDSVFKDELVGQIQRGQAENHPDVGQGLPQGQFEYNIIDQHNRKITSSISTDDSRVLINRLDQLAKRAVEET